MMRAMPPRRLCGLGKPERGTDMAASERCSHDIKPLWRGVCRVAPYDFNDIAIAELSLKRDEFSVHFRPWT